MKLRRALVTGATGHLGSNVCRALLAVGVEVTAFVRPSSDRRALGGLDVAIVEGDVLELDAFERAAVGHDVVFHNAAVFEIHTRARDALHRVAVEGTCNAVRAAAAAGARVVATSSVAAVGFADRPDMLLDESAWASLYDVPYYRAKLDAERASLKIAADLGVDIVQVLPTLVIGPGDHRVTPSSRFILDLLSGSGVTVEGGTNVIDVRDAARAMIAAAERGTSGGRYILGGQNVLVRELGTIASQVSGNSVRHVALPKWAFGAVAGTMEAVAAVTGGTPPLTRAVVRDLVGKYAWYDVVRARTELGLTCRPILDSVQDAAAFFQEEGRLDLPSSLVFVEGRS